VRQQETTQRPSRPGQRWLPSTIVTEGDATVAMRDRHPSTSPHETARRDGLLDAPLGLNMILLMVDEMGAMISWISHHPTRLQDADTSH
jgi:hypothetical protein